MPFDFESGPALLPSGYRFRLRFVFWPVEIAGRWRWHESVRIVQRFTGENAYHASCDAWWVDVGYWDEVMPIGKPAASFAEP